jgi:hypothetical protein
VAAAKLLEPLLQLDNPPSLEDKKSTILLQLRRLRAPNTADKAREAEMYALWLHSFEAGGPSLIATAGGAEVAVRMLQRSSDGVHEPSARLITNLARSNDTEVLQALENAAPIGPLVVLLRQTTSSLVSDAVKGDKASSSALTSLGLASQCGVVNPVGVSCVQRL